MQQSAPSEDEVVAAFRLAMKDGGCAYSGDIEADGQFHRVQGDDDKKHRKNVWYILYADERPAGKFGSWKGETHVWTAEGLKPLSSEEREEMRRRQAEKKAAKAAAEAERHAKAAAQSVAMWEAAQPAEEVGHPYLTKKGISGEGLRVGTFRKSLQPGPNGEDRFMDVKGALLIPMREGQTIVGLQAIYAKPIQYGGEERGKDFVYGSKKGSWPLGKPTEFDGRVTVCIAEGYATARRVRDATGLATLVAFDAGNLKPVAERLRGLLPAARIIICGDNDQFTTNNKGEPWNPGAEKAQAAADAVFGEVVLPWFHDVAEKPTDWDDLARLEGLEEVERQLMAVLRPPEAVEASEEPPEPEIPANDPASVEADRKGPPIRTIEDESDAKDVDGFFRVLGCDREHIYVYQYEQKMVVRRGIPDWGVSALRWIAPLNFWEREFPKAGKDGFDTAAAHDWLIRTAFRRGQYDPTKVRGRGIWQDDGRTVVHCGDKLIIDGVVSENLKIDSAYIYEQAYRLRAPADEPSTAAEGKAILDIMQSANWVMPASGILAAGWVALACLGGSLKWRPHIWITGGAGSGKTTVLDNINFLLGGWNLYAQGNSTEAGIRQTMKIDARPLVMDETEQNDEREGSRMQGILATARQGSSDSEAKTLKGTQGGDAMVFEWRAPVCMSSIGVVLKHQADQERFAVLALRPSRDEGAAARWDKLKVKIKALHAQTDLPARVLRRMIDNLPTLRENIEVFSRAGAMAFKSVREGDQYGTLLAAAWGLISTKVATLEEAQAMIARYDWTEYREASEVEESTKALNALMGKLVRVKGAEVQVFELAMRAADQEVEGMQFGRKESAAVLMRYGMRIKWGATAKLADAKFLIAYPDAVPELAKLMADTPFKDIKNHLTRVEGAEKNKSERFGAVVSRSIALPLEKVLNIDVEPPGGARSRPSDEELVF